MLNTSSCLFIYRHFLKMYSSIWTSKCFYIMCLICMLNGAPMDNLKEKIHSFDDETLCTLYIQMNDLQGLPNASLVKDVLMDRKIHCPLNSAQEVKEISFYSNKPDTFDKFPTGDAIRFKDEKESNSIEDNENLLCEDCHVEYDSDADFIKSTTSSDYLSWLNILKYSSICLGIAFILGIVLHIIVSWKRCK
uniref:Uncharacterized protein n=1 Tax=Lepeophtheirus salmonis TaxID=72036 RepID=A0A0K2URI2_LEPSM|nr:uncharacterized protein LOC121131910 [Lepeophtheirus salmonis]